MTIGLPPYKFDSSLKEDPVDTVQWNSFIHDLLEQLKSSKRMEIYESLGMALRVARRFDEAELYLSKAEALFDQAKSLINEFEISNSLRAAYHQHLGKLYFDQSFMGLAVTEFELALKIRKSNDNQQDQVDSTLLALNESKRLWADKNDQVVIRRIVI